MLQIKKLTWIIYQHRSYWFRLNKYKTITRVVVTINLLSLPLTNKKIREKCLGMPSNSTCLPQLLDKKWMCQHRLRKRRRMTTILPLLSSLSQQLVAALQCSMTNKLSSSRSTPFSISWRNKGKLLFLRQILRAAGLQFLKLLTRTSCKPLSVQWKKALKMAWKVKESTSLGTNPIANWFDQVWPSSRVFRTKTNKMKAE